MSQSEADTLMKSIWTGETESLKRIGVVMTQTNLDAYALANGFGKTTDAMTQAEQVQLRYKYVMEQTNLAAGDFQKTSGSWANQTRILSERWKQFMTTVGNGLLQVLTPVIQFLNTALQKLVDFSTSVSSVLSKVFGSQSKDQQQSAVATEQAAAAQGELAQNITQTGQGGQGCAKQYRRIEHIVPGQRRKQRFRNARRFCRSVRSEYGRAGCGTGYLQGGKGC